MTEHSDNSGRNGAIVEFDYRGFRVRLTCGIIKGKWHYSWKTGNISSRCYNGFPDESSAKRECLAEIDRETEFRQRHHMDSATTDADMSKKDPEGATNDGK